MWIALLRKVARWCGPLVAYRLPWAFGGGVALVLGCLLPQVAGAQRTPFIPTQVKHDDYRLPNGLRVMLVQVPDAERVVSRILVNAGGRHDPDNATGLAHYLEHMLFKGTQELGTTDYAKEKVHLQTLEALYEQLGKTQKEEERAALLAKIDAESRAASRYVIANEFDQLMEDMGCTEVNAHTYRDFTTYESAFPTQQLHRWLLLHQHRFERPVFRTFAHELEVVYEEKRRILRNWVDELHGAVFTQHPYGTHTTIGRTEHLLSPSLKQMQAFYDKYYVPGNMVLILAGNLDMGQTRQLIEQTLGKWPAKPAPTVAPVAEPKVQGVVKKQLNFYTESELTFAAYRLPGLSDAEYPLLQLMEKVLEVAENEVYTYTHREHSVWVTPAEELGGEPKAIRRLKGDNLSQDLIQTAVNHLLTEAEAQMQSAQGWVELMDSWARRGTDLNGYFGELDRLARVQENDIVDMANRWFTSNYLQLRTTANPAARNPKDKLNSPPLQPLEPQRGVQSAFAQRFAELPPPPLNPGEVNLEEIIATRKLGPGLTLHHAPNPHNRLFYFSIQVPGTAEDVKKLILMPGFLYLSGTKDRAWDQVRMRLNNWSCKMDIDADEMGLSLRVTGPDVYLEKALDQVREILTRPDTGLYSNQRAKYYIRYVQTRRKTKDNDRLGFALQEYALYGEKSYFKQAAFSVRSLFNFDAKPATQLARMLQDYLNTHLEVEYKGTRSVEEVEALVRKYFTFPKATGQRPEPIYRVPSLPSEPTVYFIPREGNARVLVLKEGPAAQPDDLPLVNALNEYLGANLSGLVFQEIREFRALAYVADAQYIRPYKAGQKGYLAAYVECKADKALATAERLTRLLNQLPRQEDRLQTVKQNLLLKLQSRKPSYDNLFATRRSWQLYYGGKDPAEQLLGRYLGLTLEELTAYYDQHLARKPAIICILGDAAKVDKKALAKFGKVIQLNSSDVLGSD